MKNSNGVKITLARNAGFCSGVERALKIVEENLEKLPRPVRMLGQLVHNEQVVRKLMEKGIKIAQSIDGIYDGTVIITAHGISPGIKKILEKRRALRVIDTTCPNVLNVQNLARKILEDGRKVIIVGDKNHQEVLGIRGAAKDKAFVISTEKELCDLPLSPGDRIGIVAQTTQEVEKLRNIKKSLYKKFKDIAFFDTTCKATKLRQREARCLAESKDAVVVIGSKNSANTARLYDICFGINSNTFFVDAAREIRRKWFEGCRSIGITAGASAPFWLIDEVIEKIRSFESAKSRIVLNQLSED